MEAMKNNLGESGPSVGDGGSGSHKRASPPHDADRKCELGRTNSMIGREELTVRSRELKTEKARMRIAVCGTAEYSNEQIIRMCRRTPVLCATNVRKDESSSLIDARSHFIPASRLYYYCTYWNYSSRCTYRTASCIAIAVSVVMFSNHLSSQFGQEVVRFPAPKYGWLKAERGIFHKKKDVMNTFAFGGNYGEIENAQRRFQRKPLGPNSYL
ncbi:hypothetical protein CBL_04618 [Carabus blaptoides fortunei]